MTGLERETENFRNAVFALILERRGAVAEIYNALHPGSGEKREDEIVWVRKNYAGRRPPVPSFTFLAGNEFLTHFLVDGEDVPCESLKDFAEDNYRGFLLALNLKNMKHKPVLKWMTVKN